MGVKEQLHKIRENWLITVLIVLVIGFIFWSNGSSTSLMGISEKLGVASYGAPYGTDAVAEAAYARGGYYPSPIYPGEDFAPDVKDRKITKNADVSSEVERGAFWDADARVKAIVSSTDSFLLTENTYKSGPAGRKSYYTGSYQLKVESKKYAAVIAQLKEIGEITSFNENMLDVTGSFTSVQKELEAEKARLARYKEILEQASTVEEKLQLTDRIFQQERTIKYLEDSLKNTDNQVAYSTISLQLTEKQSPYADIAIVKLGELLQRLMNSVNGVLQLLFWLLPYALVAGIIWWVVKKVRGRKASERKK